MHVGPFGTILWIQCPVLWSLHTNKLNNFPTTNIWITIKGNYLIEKCNSNTKIKLCCAPAFCFNFKGKNLRYFSNYAAGLWFVLVILCFKYIFLDFWKIQKNEMKTKQKIKFKYNAHFLVMNTILEGKLHPYPNATPKVMTTDIWFLAFQIFYFLLIRMCVCMHTHIVINSIFIYSLQISPYNIWNLYIKFIIKIA